MVFNTFLTLGFIVLVDRRPLPPSAIVGKAELLFLLNDPNRKDRDSDRESGLSFCNVDVWDELGEEVDSAVFLSNNVVTNLSNKAKSASLFEVRFAAVEELPEAKADVGSISEN